MNLERIIIIEVKFRLNLNIIFLKSIPRISFKMLIIYDDINWIGVVKDKKSLGPIILTRKEFEHLVLMVNFENKLKEFERILSTELMGKSGDKLF